MAIRTYKLNGKQLWEVQVSSSNPRGKLMSMVGHSQIKTTNVYLRKAGVDVQGATNKLGYGVPQSKAGKVLNLVSQK